MTLYTGTALTDVKLRETASNDSKQVGVLPKDSTIRADKKEGQWLRLSAINNAPVTGKWASTGASNQLIKWQQVPDDTQPIPPVDPPSPPSPDPIADVATTTSQAADGSIVVEITTKASHVLVKVGEKIGEGVTVWSR